MPALSYAAITTYPFQPFTKIYSADTNAMFAAISTLLNTTKLDDDNIQSAGITRATKLKLGTASHVLINDGTGAMSSEAQLSTARGGLGTDLSPSSALQAGQAIVVNSSGTGFTISSASGSSAALFNYYNFS